MQETGRKTVTLVLGGVRSGKSRWAQECATNAERVAYIATAQPLDPEMVEKIRRHRQERPSHWHTFEEPLEIGRVIAEHAAAFDLMLVDCLTVFVANLQGVADADPIRVARRIEEFMEALRALPASVVLVSNEVGSGVVPPYPAGRQFRDLLGAMNQRVAAIADHVLLMIAGLPLALKGEIGERV